MLSQNPGCNRFHSSFDVFVCERSAFSDAADVLDRLANATTIKKRSEDATPLLKKSHLWQRPKAAMEKQRHEGGSEAGRDSCLQVRNSTNENQSAGQRPHAASPQQPTETTSSKKATRTFPSLSNKVSSSVASAGHEQRSLDDRMSDIGGTLQTLFTPDEREENDRREENDDFRTPTTTTTTKTTEERGRGVGDKENFEILKALTTEGPPTVGFKRKKTNLSSSRKTPQLTKPSSPLSLGGSGGGGFTSALAAARGDGGGVVDGFGDEGVNHGPLQRFIVSQYDTKQKWFRCLQIDRVGEQSKQCNLRATMHARGSDQTKDVDSCATHAGLKIECVSCLCTFFDESTGKQCPIRANFGLPSTKEKVYCSTHAKVENGRLRDDEEKYVDVGTKTCTFFDESTGKQCPIQANFGLPSRKEKVYCSAHAKVKNGTLRDDEEKYVNVGTKMCEICGVMPGYYKIAGSVLVREDGVTFIEWKSACWYCATWQNPADVMFNKDAYTEKEGERKPEASKMFMRREHIAIQSLLKRIGEDGLNLYLVHNRVIKTGACCRDDGERHRRRLDASIIVHTRSEEGVDGEGAPILIGLECDENGHKSYDKEDEAKRVNEIQMAWGVNASVYLRFNPDGYIPCGQTTKRTGFFVRKNEDKKEIDYRLDVVWEKLKELVTHIQTHGPQDSYESVFLFFDGHNDDDFRKRD
ncbi:unnamed protein product [Bathycoccus prasinos]